MLPMLLALLSVGLGAHNLGLMLPYIIGSKVCEGRVTVRDTFFYEKRLTLCGSFGKSVINSSFKWL